MRRLTNFLVGVEDVNSWVATTAGRFSCAEKKRGVINLLSANY